MDFDPNDEDNDHFQKAIDQWQLLYDDNKSRCKDIQSKQRRRAFGHESNHLSRRLYHNASHTNVTRLVEQNISQHAPNFADHDFINTTRFTNNSNETAHNRFLRDDSPYGRGGWDPFHPSLERVSN